MNVNELAILNLLHQAVWISDPDSGQIVWANLAALEMWRAPNLEALLTRNLNPSPTIRATMAQLRDSVMAGQRVIQERTIFPLGEARRIEMTIGPFKLDDDRIGLFVEGRYIKQVDPEMVRAAEAVRYAPIVVATFSREGMMIQANTLARQTFGQTFTLNSIFAEENDVVDVLSSTEKGVPFTRDVRVFTTQGKRWFGVEMRPILDPLTGGPAILMSANDMTARIEAEQAKEDLVSIVSHELRTPMTAIKGAIELLAGGMAKDDAALSTELLQMAAENTRRLSALVDDLLDVRKITSGSLSVDFKPCNLQQILHSTLAMHAPAAQARNIKIACDAREVLPVNADEGRIQQVLLNLISNALKHTPPGGCVVVAGERIDDRVRVSVTDDGPGVPEEFRERIFQRFAQADSSSTRTNSGTGLGLYIAKTLVEIHGGKLAFDNSENAGAIFFFELPALTTSNDDASVITEIKH